LCGGAYREVLRMHSQQAISRGHVMVWVLAADPCSLWVPIDGNAT
jgi:hypothetical protein